MDRWYEVVFPEKSNKEILEIRYWLETVLYPNCNGSYHVGTSMAWFQSEDDAIFFKLVWG